jgi:hypothetical protein
MEFNYVSDGIDAVVIDNFYTEEQLKEIMLELKWLTKPAVLCREDKLSSAVDESGFSLTSKTGVFLEQVFKNWEHSAIIKYGFEQMSTDIFKTNILKYNTLFKTIFACNSRTHLVSYYENADYYKKHTDVAVFTLLNYFYKEPKQFDGGDIILHSYNSEKKATIEIKNNRVVLIASATTHEVSEIKSKLNNTLSGNGRYCSATFFNIVDSRKHNGSN